MISIVRQMIGRAGLNSFLEVEKKARSLAVSVLGRPSSCHLGLGSEGAGLK